MIQVTFYFGSPFPANWLARKLAEEAGGATVTRTAGVWTDQSDTIRTEAGATVVVLGSPSDSELEGWKVLARTACQRWGEREVLMSITHLIDVESLMASDA